MAAKPWGWELDASDTQDEAAASHFAPAKVCNRHARERALHRQRVLQAMYAPRWRWSEGDLRALRGALRAQLLEEAFRRSFERRSGSLGSLAQKQRLFVEIWLEVAELEVNGVLKHDLHTIDWLTVADKVNLAVIPPSATLRFSPSSCKINYMHRTAAESLQDSSSKLEDAALLRAVHESGPFHWEQLARQGKSQHSAWQCFIRYKRRIQSSTNTPWTVLENRRLLALHTEIAAEDCWELVAARLGEGHAPHDCRRRWKALLASASPPVSPACEN